MKSVFLFITSFLFCLAGNAQNVSEILKNPAAANAVVFNGQKNESKNFVANASKFTKLNQATITGINDSVQFEQILLAIAACPAVNKITISKCGISGISGAIRMLTTITDVKISACNRLGADQAFTVLSEMPGLVRLEYEMPNLKGLPRSFMRLRTLEEIKIVNRDLSLADGYALNTKSPSQLYAERSTQLGFGNASLRMSYGCYDASYASAHLVVMRDMLQGTVGSSGEMPLIGRAKPFDSNHPLVKAPIPGLDVRKNVYETNAASGGMIEYPSGTKIMIPANAFVDVNGKSITGNVTIDYREFRDQVDILVSGIPMKYDSAGQVGDFESAGMFEMNASVNGQEVFLAPGKNITMDFAVVDTASSFNFYELDKEKGWVYKNTTGQTEAGTIADTKAETVQSLTDAVIEFRTLLAKSRVKPYKVGDTLTIEERYEDTTYFYTEKSRYENRTATNFKGWRKYELKNATYWRMNTVSSKRGTVCFSLYRDAYNLFSQCNPEMSSYAGTTWMLNEPVDKKTLRAMKSSRSGINDIRIEYLGGSDYQMELKFPWGHRSFSVSAVHVSDREPKFLPEKRCAQMHKSYSRRLNRRILQDKRSVQKMIAKWNLRNQQAKQDSLNKWQQVKPVMNQPEDVLDFVSWNQYVNDEVLRVYCQTEKKQAQSAAVCQALSIMKFGIYNCDQIRRISNPVEVYALAKTPSGNTRNASQMFVIDRKRNQVFSYYSQPGTAVSIAFGRNAENRLIAIDADGAVSVADPKTFGERKTNANGIVVFETTDLSDSPVTTEELRKAIFPEKYQ